KRKGPDSVGLIFKTAKGGQIKEISKTYFRTLEELGFNKNITDSRQKGVFHTLRHSYASRLVMENVDLYTVQKLMGHSTISMTERYSHLAPDHLKKAVNVLN
ncbi:MAG: tyrosine-type recombinase/integrase, partial [Holosporaceae bacterium]|nr:tyrosine-type recombinase/integrase [Holosporaceae bacterium]